MATGSLNITVSSRGFEQRLGAIAGVARSPMTGAERRETRLALRASVGRDWRARAWHTPTGGVRPWKPVNQPPFGTYQKSNPPLRRYLRAWQGGPGGFEKSTPTSVQIGVRLPGAAAHRGSFGSFIGERVTLIKARRRTGSGKLRMQLFLGLEYGVWIGEAKLLSGLELHSRPHATKNPELVKQLADIQERHLLKAGT